jgi:hypothetical protein
VIVEGPTTEVPAKPKNNVVEWISVYMPTKFTKDTWVTSVQIKPEKRLPGTSLKVSDS